MDLALEGMTCAACAARIEKVLNRLPGVSANVNFAVERARVRYAPDTVDIQRIIEAVRKAGYGARPIDEASRAQDETREAEAYRPGTNAAHRLGRAHGAVPRSDGHDVRWRRARAHTAVVAAGTRNARSVLDREALLYGAWHALRGGGANMDVLVALGTTMAYAYSAVVVCSLCRMHVYFEASTAIITLVLMGKLLEARARSRASAAIEELTQAPAPDSACRNAAAGPRTLQWPK